MDLVLIKINDRVDWQTKIEWAKKLSSYDDATDWAAWSIGLDDIYFYLNEEDATIYLLKYM